MTIVLGFLAALLLAATLLSFAPIPHGAVRGLSFPRLQMLAIALAAMPLTVWLAEPPTARWLILAAEAAAAAVQAASILPFTPLWKKQSKSFRATPSGPGTSGGPGTPGVFSILSCNIKMSNRDYASTLAMVAECDPDIAIFMETDRAWCDALTVLQRSLPHVVAAPFENAYGMILFSRLPLGDTRTECLVMDEVPFIAATVTLRDGQRFRLHAVHPEPPVPSTDSLGRDAELLKVAEIVREEPLPSIVSGDLNDVAWSHTTRLFQRVSGLLDPRVGRGFYNTFDARFPFLRWPLDHLFHDARFAFVAMRRLAPGGSDHFPMYFRLALTPSAEGANRPEPEDAADAAEKRGILDESRTLDREAIGVDWET